MAGESVDVGVSDRIVLAAANRNCFVEVCTAEAASPAGASKRCLRCGCLLWVAIPSKKPHTVTPALDAGLGVLPAPE